jgi:hypothetical protein
MNLSEDKRRFQGGDSGAGGSLGTAAHAGPAHPHYEVGAAGFGPAWTMEDSMAASIVRLECEKSEFEAEVAMLKEAMLLLAKERNEAQQRLREMEDQRDFAMGVIKRLEADRLRPRQGASLYDIAESVREKYDPEYEREGIEN